MHCRPFRKTYALLYIMPMLSAGAVWQIVKILCGLYLVSQDVCKLLLLLPLLLILLLRLMIMIIRIMLPLFVVLSSWNYHCRSSLCSCEAEHQTAADFLSFDQANQPEPVDPSVESYSDYIHHRHVLLFLILTADTRFTISWRAEG